VPELGLHHHQKLIDSAQRLAVSVIFFLPYMAANATATAIPTTKAIWKKVELMFMLILIDGDPMRQLLVVVIELALGVEKNALNNLRVPSATAASYNNPDILSSRLGWGILDTARLSDFDTCIL